MAKTEKELCEIVQQRIVDGLLTELEYDLFIALIKALNQTKNSEDQKNAMDS
jgi:hypothetical protein